eukprot:Sspe_Gene.26244::Locus_10785_Transcript_1_1_Confidence_1.000_Length_2999::g.26244::m.26244
MTTGRGPRPRTAPTIPGLPEVEGEQGFVQTLRVKAAADRIQSRFEVVTVELPLNGRLYPRGPRGTRVAYQKDPYSEYPNPYTVNVYHQKAGLNRGFGGQPGGCTLPHPPPSKSQPAVARKPKEITKAVEGGKSYSSTFLTEVQSGKRDTEPSAGFTQLSQSMEKVLERLKPEGLSERWSELSQWIDRYYVDQDVQDIERRCREMLAEAYKRDRESNRKHPNQVMTAVACTVLDDLLFILSKYDTGLAPVCRAVQYELMGAIFVSSPVGESYAMGSASGNTMLFLEARPYYTVVRDMSQRMGHAEETVQHEVMKGEKQMAVMNRAVCFWQEQFKKMLLKAWRNQNRAKHVLAERDRALQSAKAEVLRGKRQVEELQREVATLRTTLTTAIQDEAKKWEEKVRGLESLRSDVASLTAERDRLMQEMALYRDRLAASDDTIAILKNDVVEYSKLLKETVQQCLEGPAWEVSRQEVFRYIIEHEVFDDDQLAEWFNRAVEQGGGKVSVQSFGEWESMLDGYPFLMHFMSPTAVSSSDVDKVASEVDPLGKAKLVIDQLHGLGVITPFTPDDLALPGSGLQHLVVVTLLFQRFADSGLALACSHPPLNGPDAVQGGGLWDGPLPSSVEKWRKRISDSWDRLTRWRGVAGLSQGNLTETLIRRVMGTDSPESTAGERRDQNLYCSEPVSTTSAYFKRVARLFPSSSPECQREVDAVQEALVQHFRTLRKIFLFYCSSDSKARDLEISVEEVWKLVQDVKLSKAVAKQSVVELFAQANGREGGKKETLNQTEYVQMLLLLAGEKFKDKGCSLSSKFRALMETHVVPNAQWTDADEFKRTLNQADIRGVLKEYRDFASQVYSYYCSKAVGGGRKMGLETFVDLANDLHITDSVLTHEAVRQVFLKMQDTYLADNRLEFHEFLECLCALAAYKSPAPFLPLSRRVARFFQVWFVPTLSQHVRKR